MRLGHGDRGRPLHVVGPGQLGLGVRRQIVAVHPTDAPAAEKPVNYWLMAMYRVECGKLAEQWVVADYVTMLRQSGILTDDELATLGSAAAATPQP